MNKLHIENLNSLRCDAHGQLSYLEKNSEGLLKQKKLRWKSLFPQTEAQGFGALLNEKGEEEFLVEDLKTLPEFFQLALRQCHERSSLGILIESVIDITEGAEMRIFEVSTQFGIRKVFSKNDDWPETMGTSGLAIVDLFGDQYCIPSFERLDEKSKKLLLPFYDRLEKR